MLIVCWLYDIICRLHVDDVDFHIFSPCNFQQVIHTGPICPILSPEDPMMTLSPKRSRPRNGRRAYWGSSPDPIASWCFVMLRGPDPHGPWPPTAKHGTMTPPWPMPMPCSPCPERWNVPCAVWLRRPQHPTAAGREWLRWWKPRQCYLRMASTGGIRDDGYIANIHS